MRFPPANLPAGFLNPVISFPEMLLVPYSAHCMLLSASAPFLVLLYPFRPEHKSLSWTDEVETPVSLASYS